MISLNKRIKSIDELKVGKTYYWCSNSCRYDFHSGYYTGRQDHEGRVEMHENYYPLGPNDGIWAVRVTSLWRKLPSKKEWYRNEARERETKCK